MLKKVIWTAIIIGLPIIIAIALQYGQIKTIPISQGIAEASSKSDADQHTKLMVRGKVLVDQIHQIAKGDGKVEFWLRDDLMTDCLVAYDGSEQVNLENMQTITVAGHFHGGERPYFHGSQIIVGR